MAGPAAQATKSFAADFRITAASRSAYNRRASWAPSRSLVVGSITCMNVEHHRRGILGWLGLAVACALLLALAPFIDLR
jgi:hypothetical protein